MVLPIDIPNKKKSSNDVFNKTSDDIENGKIPDHYFDIGTNMCPNNSTHHVYLVFNNNGIPFYYKCKECSYRKLYTNTV